MSRPTMSAITAEIDAVTGIEENMVDAEDSLGDPGDPGDPEVFGGSVARRVH